MAEFELRRQMSMYIEGRGTTRGKMLDLDVREQATGEGAKLAVMKSSCQIGYIAYDVCGADCSRDEITMFY
jgi:hypothetical protein